MITKVGDIIYFERGSQLVHREAVERITPSGIIRTRLYNLKEEHNGHLRITGQDGWSRTWAKRETPEVTEQWRKQVATTWLAMNYQRIKPEDIEPLMEKYPNGKA